MYLYFLIVYRKCLARLLCRLPWIVSTLCGTHRELGFSTSKGESLSSDSIRNVSFCLASITLISFFVSAVCTLWAFDMSLTVLFISCSSFGTSDNTNYREFFSCKIINNRLSFRANMFTVKFNSVYSHRYQLQKYHLCLPATVHMNSLILSV